MTAYQILATCLFAAAPVLTQPALAQPAPGQAGRPNGRGFESRGVEFGHIHLNSADPDAAIEFWKNVIGAEVYNRGSIKGVSMIGAMILFTHQKPSGPSAGSVIDHIGLKVPDLQPFTDRLAKTPYKSFRPADGDDRLMIDGPDGVRIELTEDNSMYPTLEFSHMHMHTSQPKEMQAWYGKNFGGRPGPPDEPDSSLFRGATLIYVKDDAAAPSAGRAIDHIGFEIKGLEAFCKTLSDGGVKLDSPYKFVPELQIGIAFLTDPWGTRVELTEGLKK